MKPPSKETIRRVMAEPDLTFAKLQSAAHELSLSIGAMTRCSPNARDELHNYLIAFAMAVVHFREPEAKTGLSHESVGLLIDENLRLRQDLENERACAITADMALKIERIARERAFDEALRLLGGVLPGSNRATAINILGEAKTRPPVK